MSTKSPEIKRRCSNNTWFSQSARQAFESILSCYGNEQRKILLPGYIGITDREGSGVFDPVKATKTDFDFYPLNKRLEMDKATVENSIRSQQYFAILVIHYFGFCQTDMVWLREMCEENSVIIIEDCAHLLQGSVGSGDLGTLGEYSIYALHKILSSDTGGMLRVSGNVKDFKPNGLVCPDANVLETMLITDMDLVSSIRVSNYKNWLKRVTDVKGITPMYDVLPNGIIPHNFPVIISDGLREKLYFKLIENDVPVVALYYRMIPELPRVDFEDAYFVSENILNFPVHQDITASDIETMSEKLAHAMENI